MRAECVISQFRGKSVKRFPNPKDPSVWSTRTTSEDLMNGCFDGVGIRRDGTMLFVQWTEGGKSAVRQRMDKIRVNFCAEMRDSAGSDRQDLVERWETQLDVELWQYVPRKGFHVWAWCWRSSQWRAGDFRPNVASTKQKKKRSSNGNREVPRASEADARQVPF